MICVFININMFTNDQFDHDIDRDRFTIVFEAVKGDDFSEWRAVYLFAVAIFICSSEFSSYMACIATGVQVWSLVVWSSGSASERAVAESVNSVAPLYHGLYLTDAPLFIHWATACTPLYQCCW